MSSGGSLHQVHSATQASSSTPASRKGGRVLPFTPRPHRYWCENDLILHYGPRIGPEGVAVYSALQCFANRKTGQCWPAVPTIAKTLGMGQPRVRKTLRKLEKEGLVTWEERYSEAGDQTSHLYTVHPATASAQVSETQGTNKLFVPPDAADVSPAAPLHTVREGVLTNCAGNKFFDPSGQKIEQELRQDDTASTPQKTAKPPTRRTIECSMDALNAAVAAWPQEAAALEALEVCKQEDPIRYAALEKRALEVCLANAGGRRAFVFAMDLKFTMLRLLEEGYAQHVSPDDVPGPPAGSPPAEDAPGDAGGG